jgi:ABC-type multidrug transport system ATPase subunit
MMALFREIANQGKTVVCITHNVDNVSLCDLVAVLAGGKLAYYGPPAALPAHFGVSKISEVYDKLETRPAEVWERNYKASGHYREFVQDRLQAVSGSMRAGLPSGRRVIEPLYSAETQRQLGVLTRRYFTVLAQNRKNAAILLAQAPLIGLLLGMVFGGDIGAHQ